MSLHDWLFLGIGGVGLVIIGLVLSRRATAAPADVARETPV